MLGASASHSLIVLRSSALDALASTPIDKTSGRASRLKCKEVGGDRTGRPDVGGPAGGGEGRAEMMSRISCISACKSDLKVPMLSSNSVCLLLIASTSMFVSVTVSLRRSNLMRIAFSYWARTSVFSLAMNFCMRLFESSSKDMNSFLVRMPSAPGGVTGVSVQGRFPPARVRVGDATECCMIASLAVDSSFVADDGGSGILQQRTKKVQVRSIV